MEATRSGCFSREIADVIYQRHVTLSYLGLSEVLIEGAYISPCRSVYHSAYRSVSFSIRIAF